MIAMAAPPNLAATTQAKAMTSPAAAMNSIASRAWTNIRTKSQTSCMPIRKEAKPRLFGSSTARKTAARLIAAAIRPRGHIHAIAWKKRISTAITRDTSGVAPGCMETCIRST